jgi:hypothetical protein
VPKFAPSAKPLGKLPSAPKTSPQKPSTKGPFAQKPLAQQFGMQKPKTAPKGGTGKPQTAYLAETAKLIGMSFSWKDVAYEFGSVAVGGTLYPTITVMPYTLSGDVRVAGTPVKYDPTSADWSSVAYQALSAFKAYTDDIASRNANATVQSATTGTSADVAVPVTPSTTTADAGAGKLTVTSEATGEGYTLTDTSMYTPPSQTEDAETIRLSETTLATDAQQVVDEALSPAEGATTVSSDVVAASGETFLSKYKWWLAAGGVAAAGYVLLHRSNPSTYPLPAALSKLVR